MKTLSPHEFFDLSNFLYPELFEGCLNVWDALDHLPLFFDRFQQFEILTEIPIGSHIVNRESIFIGKGVVIEPGAYIRGPCVIGENSIVRQGAYIRGSFVCGKDCVIGHDTEIKNAIFLNGVHAAHFAYVGDCILGNNVNLGAGTKCANLRFDRKPILITFPDSPTQSLETGRKKLGAIMGDDSQTGCNSVTLPGTCAGKGAVVNAGIVIGGYIPPHYLVASEHKPILKALRK